MLEILAVFQFSVSTATGAEGSLPRVLGLSRKAIRNELSRDYELINVTERGYDFSARKGMLSDQVRVRFLNDRCECVNYDLSFHVATKRAFAFLEKLLPGEEWTRDTSSEQAKTFRDVWEAKSGGYKAHFNDFLNGSPEIRYEIVRSMSEEGLTVISSRYEKFMLELAKKTPPVIPGLPSN